MTRAENPRPICRYCLTEARLVGGDKIYPRRQDLHDKKFWSCFPCRAWVGCHPGTDEPLGTLANSALRRWRNRAHAAFDPLWKGEGAPFSRTEAYAWLAEQLKVDPQQCHVGHFDEFQCKAAEDLSRALQARRARVTVGDYVTHCIKPAMQARQQAPAKETETTP